MKIHEYQAKAIFERHGIPIPKGGVAFSAEEALKIAQGLGAKGYVVKAQVHAGGRGKGGGVKKVETLSEVETAARGILGTPLVTVQTGPEGKRVNRLLVEEAVEFKQELYLGITVDRAEAAPVIIVSGAGGVEIEEIAATRPELILKEVVNPLTGLCGYQCRNLVFGLGLEAGAIRSLTPFLQRVYEVFAAYDCSLVEINPLVITKDDGFLALDAKINFDDNALARHPELKELRDPDEEDALERKAGEFNLNYIRLGGNVGAMVNGAGLAMATMDLIKLAGAEPANFLDVGGGANKEMIEAGFKIILGDPRVEAILINIFGGILRCDVLAEGVLQAARTVDIHVPLIVRLQGTNVEEGRRILRESGLDFQVAETISDAARLVAAAVKS